MATWYVDFTNGNDANTGTSFAQRLKNLSALAGKGAVAGETCRVMASGDPSSLGVNGTFTNGSKTITLSGALNANVDLCDAAWTAGAGVTTSTTATNRQGTNAATFVIGGGYVNGNICAYKTMSSTNFSGYQQLSLWVKCTATTAAGDWEVRLCSDTLGVTAVDTFALPAIIGANGFQAVVVDKAANMGAAIQSVALYRIAGSGTPTLTLDNIIACKAAASADCLTHLHLIGKNTVPSTPSGSCKEWFPIQSINGTTVAIDIFRDTTAASSGGPYMVTETVAAYARLPLLTTTGQSTGVVGTVAAGNFVISGGWNTTDMSTKTGDTYIQVPNSISGSALLGGNRQTWQNMHAYGGSQPFNINYANFCVYTDCSFACGSYGTDARYTYYGNATFTRCFIMGGYYGFLLGGGNHRFDGCRAQYGYYLNIQLNCGNSLLTNCVFGGVPSGPSLAFPTAAVGGAGIGGNVLRNCEFSGNATGDITIGAGHVYLDNCLMSSATEVNTGSLYSGTNTTAFSTNHDQTAGNHQQFMEGGKIISDSTTRHTASGIAWKLSPTSTVRDSTYPLRTKIATVYCVSGVQTTVSAYFAKDHANISVGLFIRGGQLGGPASDTTQLSTCGTGSTYESTATQIQWTPTSTGWVEVEAICYTSASTTSNGWVDDMNVVYG